MGPGRGGGVEELVIPELTVEEWTAWINDRFARVRCPVEDCLISGAAYWNGVDETITWTHEGHQAFIPEGRIPWPPPETHTRR
jgi:hypothetical protein